jgi:hypothetical protein
MNTVVLVWVLVVGAHGDNTPLIISPLVADLASCERMQQAVRNGRSRSSQCVEIKVLK